MPKSILDAISEGIWDYEPDEVSEEVFESTRALPGTGEKLEVLAARVQAGLPLWHNNDRLGFDD